MRTPAFHKYYATLSPHERFRLAVQAESRHDEEEFRKIIESCPRVAYDITDPQFYDRVQVTRDIATAFQLQLGPIYARISLIHGLQYAHEKVSTEADQRDHSLLQALNTISLNGLLKHFGTEAFMLWNTFSHFCRHHLEIEPEVVLGAFMPASLEQLQFIQRVTPECPENNQLHDETAELFKRIWTTGVLPAKKNEVP